MNISVIRRGKKYIATLSEFESLDPSIVMIENDESMVDLPIIISSSIAELLLELNKVIRKEIEFRFSL